MEWKPIHCLTKNVCGVVLLLKLGRKHRGAAKSLVKPYLAKITSDKKRGIGLYIAPYTYWQDEWDQYDITHWLPLPPIPAHPSRESYNGGKDA